MTDADAQDAVVALADALAESSERECGHALGGYPLKDWAVLMCCPRCVCRYCAAEVAREHVAEEIDIARGEWGRGRPDDVYSDGVREGFRLALRIARGVAP